jgi:hypothetical protein
VLKPIAKSGNQYINLYHHTYSLSGARKMWNVLSRSNTHGNRKYSVYGASRVLVEWLEESSKREDSLAKKVFGNIDGQFDNIMECFDANDTEAHIRAGKKLITMLWSKYPEFGPYPLLDVLSAFQFTGVFYGGYRDHVVHQFKVFLLGLYLYEKCDEIRDAVNTEIRDEPNNSYQENEIEGEFIRRWTAASIFHDVGYVLEINGVNKPESEKWKQTKNALNNCLKTPFSYMTDFESTIDSSSEDRIWQYVPNRPVEFMSPGELDSNGEIINNLEDFGRKAGLGNENPIKDYYNFAKSETPIGRKEPFYDHGIVSAIILFKIVESFQNQLCLYLKSHKKKKNVPKFSLSVDEAIGKIAKNKSQTIASMTAAAGAIALHNINKSMWDSELKGRATGQVINIQAFRVRLNKESNSGHEPTPLAFLLMLSDTLQDWDRPRFRLQDKAKQSLTDQDFYLAAKNNTIWIALKDDEKYVKQGEEPESRFNAMKNCLKENLQEDVIEKLIRPFPSMQSSMIYFDCTKQEFQQHLAGAEKITIIGLTNEDLGAHLLEAWKFRKKTPWEDIRVVYAAKKDLENYQTISNANSKSNSVKENWENGVERVRAVLCGNPIAKHFEIRHSATFPPFVGQLYDDKIARVSFIHPSTDLKNNCYINFPVNPPCSYIRHTVPGITGADVPPCKKVEQQNKDCEECDWRIKHSPCHSIQQTFDKIQSASTPLFAANIVGEYDGNTFSISGLIPQKDWQSFRFPSGATPVHLVSFVLLRYKSIFFLLLRNEGNSMDQQGFYGVISGKVNDEDFFINGNPDEKHRERVYNMQIAYYDIDYGKDDDLGKFWNMHIRPLTDAFKQKFDIQDPSKESSVEKLLIAAKQTAVRSLQEKMRMSFSEDRLRYIPGQFLVDKSKNGFNLFAYLFVVDLESQEWEQAHAYTRLGKEFEIADLEGKNMTEFLRQFANDIKLWNEEHPWKINQQIGVLV